VPEDERMKSVLYVTTSFPTLASFLENEVRRLHEHGVRVQVATLRRASRAYQPEHAPLVALTCEVGSLLDPRAWWALLAWTVRRPHVLVPGVIRVLWASRGSLYALGGHLAYLPAAARVATLAEAGGFDRIHGAWAHFPASVAWLAARLTDRRFSMAGHAGSDLYRTQAFLAEKVAAADFVLTCVRRNAEMLRGLCGDGASVICSYHGVEAGRFDGAGRAPSREPLLLAVGRLAATKGFDTAIRALTVLGTRGLRPRLVLVGDGPDRAALERLAAAGGVLGQVEFRGTVGQADLLPLYREAWLLLAPSRALANGRVDGIPNVIVEALAMGLPCVGTRAGGIEEVVVAGVNGVLVAADDPAALAGAVEPLLRDPLRLERLSAGARASIGDRFDAGRNFQTVLALMLGDRAPTGG
jgi:colanic acid/amylovoran biosynthesis glycosyltransferase